VSMGRCRDHQVHRSRSGRTARVYDRRCLLAVAGRNGITESRASNLGRRTIRRRSRSERTVCSLATRTTSGPSR
jgi:hypothetical protein